MSGHGATDQDLRALAFLACRLRKETHGCREWDEPGAYAVLKAELLGKNLAHAVEVVLCHATDPEAKTPGAIKRQFIPPKPSAQPKGRPQPPKKGEDCPHHPGQPKGQACGGCRADKLAAADDDGPTTAPPPAWTPGDPVAGAKACRAAMKDGAQ